MQWQIHTEPVRLPSGFSSLTFQPNRQPVCETENIPDTHSSASIDRADESFRTGGMNETSIRTGSLV